MLGDLSIHRRMDSIKPPDEDRPNELVPSEANGVALPSGTSEVPDPVSLRILLGGGILMGIILVARVKQVGPVEFYEGIPAKLPDVVQAALELPPS